MSKWNKIKYALIGMNMVNTFDLAEICSLSIEDAELYMEHETRWKKDGDIWKRLWYSEA